MHKRRFCFYLVVLLGLVPALSAWAQSGPVLDVRAGFDGYYKPSAWVPVKNTRPVLLPDPKEKPDNLLDKLATKYGIDPAQPGQQAL